MWKYGIFQCYNHFLAQVLICEVLQTHGLTEHTENALWWKHSPYNLEHKSWCCCEWQWTSEARDMLPIPFLCSLSSCLPVKVWPSKFISNISRSESTGEITLREENNKNGYKSSSLKVCSHYQIIWKTFQKFWTTSICWILQKEVRKV